MPLKKFVYEKQFFGKKFGDILSSSCRLQLHPMRYYVEMSEVESDTSAHPVLFDDFSSSLITFTVSNGIYVG